MDSILLIEDDRFFRETFAALLLQEGYQVETAVCGSDGLDLLAEGRSSVVITDLVLPDMSGLDILSRIRERYPAVDVILVTGNANLESAIFALKNGARDYLVKPVNPDELKHSVAQCVRQRRLLDENEALRNILSLFRASQSIASCLDLDSLYQLLVDAVIRESGVASALGYFMTGTALELKVARGVSAELGTLMLEDIDAELDAASADRFTIGSLDLTPEKYGGFTGGSLIPVKSPSESFGMIVLLATSKDECRKINGSLKNIQFLVEQSLRAFENAETFSKTKDMLFIDDVSGLYNHRYLEVALEREMMRLERYSSHLAVLFIDVDSFKTVNDMHGHLVGSRVLSEFGALIKKSVRDIDVVIRYGGDEYTAILVETTCDTALLVAERIRKQVEAHPFKAGDGQTIHLTCSIGYACCPEDTVSKDKLLEMADRAMYSGKASGKNRVQRVVSSD